MSIEDDLRQAVGKRQGSAIRFTDIEGVGQKTAQKIRQSGRITGPSDVSDMTADELSEQAGISERRARKAIQGGGGNPDRKPRSNTGSVSAAGIRVPTGEFKPEIGDKDNAEARFEASLNKGFGRSQEAAAADKGKRAPVTTDYERWKDNKGELDFPGVDTPTDDPTVKPKDLRQKQRPATTDPPDPPEPRRDDTGSAVGALSSSLGVSPEQRRDSMVADGMGGVRFNSKAGGYVETDAPGEEQRPPAEALERQGRELEADRRERAAEQAGALEPNGDPFDLADNMRRDVLSDDEIETLTDEFQSATESFDEIDESDAADFLDEAAFRKAANPSLETGDTLAVNTTNTLLDQRRSGPRR